MYMYLASHSARDCTYTIEHMGLLRVPLVIPHFAQMLQSRDIDILNNLLLIPWPQRLYRLHNRDWKQLM